MSAAQDKPDAKELALSSATIEFDHVAFEYTRGAQVLRSISFRVEGGQTCALACHRNSSAIFQMRAEKLSQFALSHQWWHDAFE